MSGTTSQRVEQQVGRVHMLLQGENLVLCDFATDLDLNPSALNRRARKRVEQQGPHDHGTLQGGGLKPAPLTPKP